MKYFSGTPYKQLVFRLVACCRHSVCYILFYLGSVNWVVSTDV